jgi:predicted urease superfamily metal-dependent hydrolase
MNSIERRIEKLEQTANSGEIRSFEEMMSECVRVMDALRGATKLETLKLKKFHPVMRAGLAKAIPDLQQAMCEALENQEWLPLEVTAQVILIYQDAGTRDLLTPTLTELVETILQLGRAGKLAVGA